MMLSVVKVRVQVALVECCMDVTAMCIFIFCQRSSLPVKFWLVENFLSPQFKAFIPSMAEHYGFQVELVTYKWPNWLRQQTEKQRIIWGYKILFLDVLFPLDVKKVRATHAAAAGCRDP